MAEPIVQEDLYHLITTARIEDALYLTGVMVLDDKIHELEDIWIRACSGNELKEKLPSSWKWKDIIEDTYKLVKSDAFDITDALVLTAKQCIFYKEILVVENGENNILGKNPTVHIKQLRNVIVEDFPEDATLSHAGVKRYTRILPVATEELLFAHRILSGLSRIWTEKQYQKSRDALEYLSRRKLQIELPDKSWPSPTPETANQFIWFLWGAVLCFFQHADIVQKIMYLFKARPKKTKKQHQYYGLLWHIFYIAGNVEGSPWTIDENKWINYVQTNASQIWDQIRVTQEELKETEKTLKKASGHASPVEDFDEIFGYIPRTGEGHITPENEIYEPSYIYTNRISEPDIRTEKKIKIVGLKSSRDPNVVYPTVRKLE